MGAVFEDGHTHASLRGVTGLCLRLLKKSRPEPALAQGVCPAGRPLLQEPGRSRRTAGLLVVTAHRARCLPSSRVLTPTALCSGADLHLSVLSTQDLPPSPEPQPRLLEPSQRHDGEGPMWGTRQGPLPRGVTDCAVSVEVTSLQQVHSTCRLFDG